MPDLIWGARGGRGDSLVARDAFLAEMVFDGARFAPE